MNSPPKALAARKSLLLARSSLYRLVLEREALELRESLQWRRVGSAMASSVPVRPLLIGALILLVGRRRVTGLVGLATRAIMLVKLVRTVSGLATRKKAP